MKKVHIEVCEEVVTELLVWYWRKRIPKHFEQNARGKYQYKGRHPDYKRRKKRARKGITDLVFKGTTREVMSRQFPKITFPKKGRVSGTITGRAKLARFPFPIARVQKTTGVTVPVMASEISRWSDEEIKEVTERFGKLYVKKWKNIIKTRPRWRKILAGRLQAHKR